MFTFGHMVRVQVCILHKDFALLHTCLLEQGNKGRYHTYMNIMALFLATYHTSYSTSIIVILVHGAKRTALLDACPLYKQIAFTSALLGL